MLCTFYLNNLGSEGQVKDIYQRHSDNLLLKWLTSTSQSKERSHSPREVPCAPAR